jgi:hypothetical protein
MDGGIGPDACIDQGLMNVRRREISVHVDESNNDVL